MKTHFLKLTLAAAISLTSQGIFAAEKVALVIGNGIYKDENLNLKNPVNDAQDMKAALEKVGFKVIYVENATIDQMDEVRKEFRKSLDSDSLALFYYSGHGVQADGINYLIPSDAKIEGKADLKRRAYDVGYFLDEMGEAQNRANIIILDACRNNPFKSIRAIGDTKGLTAPTETPKGSIIAYATAPNSVASDNPSERNGIYTKYLKQYLFKPGLKIEDALKEVRKSVMKENGEQIPWENSSLTGDLCLAGCSVKPVQTNSPPLLSLVSGADSVKQNKSYTIKFKATDDDGDLSKIFIDWGDDSTPTSKSAKNGATLTFTHTYKFAGIYDLIATAIDKQKNESETVDKSVDVTAVTPVVTQPDPIVTIPKNSAPTIKKLTSSTTVAGQIYSLQLQASDIDKNLSLLTIDWGDGASNFENLSGANSTVSLSHTYATSGSYTWKAIAYDSNDAEGTKSETINVTQPVVQIVIPSVDNATATPNSVISGNAITFSATLSQTLPSGYSVKVDYGNGFVSLSGSGTNYSVSATPIKLGAQTFTVGIYDNKGALKSNKITGNFSVAEIPVVIEKPIETQPTTVTTSASKLNDTGIITCSDSSKNGLSCPVSDFPNQDAQSGRDVTKNDDSDGVAGFSFTKISSTGKELAASSTEWNCVKDNVTGLIWENKTTDGGLHDWKHTYTWYEPDNTKNGGNVGTKNGGSCKGSDCDTNAYVKAVNAAGWCGYKDWRLPTVEELQSIVNYGTYNPAIDTNYFPNTQSSWFWSSSPNASYSDYAWNVSFNYGDASYGYKDYYNFVRLVRG